MLCLVAEDLHSKEGAQTAKARGKEKESLFGDPPFSFLGLGFVCSVQYERDDGHYCVKYKKNFHGYIIIVEMKITKRPYNVFSKTVLAVLCMTAFILMPGCSILEDDDPSGRSSGVKASASDHGTSDESETEATLGENDTGYERICKAYIYSAWYDVEKDNPVDYTSIDSNDAYALKCVFYFNEPVTGAFRAVLKKDGKQLAVKDFRISEKVVSEIEFSAGLEGIGTFEKGAYTVSLETEDKSVAVSDVMRVN